MRDLARRLAGPATAVLAAAVGGLVCLTAAGRVWVRATADSPVLGAVPITSSGREVAPVVPAIALVALAGAVALALGRVLARRLAGLLLVAAAAVAAAAVVEVARAPAAGAGAEDAVARAAGAVGPLQVTSTGWLWVAGLGTVLIGAAGAVAVLRARAWDASRHRSARFEPPRGTGRGDGRRPARPPSPSAAWDALTLGQDPTQDPLRESSRPKPPT